MHVTVRLFGNLRRHLPPQRESLELELAPGTRVSDVIAQLGIDEGVVGVAAINDAAVAETAELHDGDCLDLFAVMGGGGTGQARALQDFAPKTN